MATFSLTASAPPAVGAQDEEEKPYWEMADDTSREVRERQQRTSGGCESEQSKGGMFPRLPGRETDALFAGDFGTMAKQLGDRADKSSAKMKSEGLAAYRRCMTKLELVVSGSSPVKNADLSQAAEVTRYESLDQGDMDREAVKTQQHRCSSDTIDAQHHSSSAVVNSHSGQAKSQSSFKRAAVDLLDAAVEQLVELSGQSLLDTWLGEGREPDREEDLSGNDPGEEGVAGVEPEDSTRDECTRTSSRTPSVLGSRGWTAINTVYESAVAVMDESLGDLLS